VSGVDAVRAWKRLGFVQLRQTGSHLILRKDNRTVVVPQLCRIDAKPHCA
jgi:predicted RNA binding protein YcfA (HicA-like mRNA interferase family)